MKMTRLETLGLLGIVSLLSYSAMVFISPFFYPGYNSLTMAVIELSAHGSPSKAIADQLNALFGPCGLVSIVAVWASVNPGKTEGQFRNG